MRYPAIKRNLSIASMKHNETKRKPDLRTLAVRIPEDLYQELRADVAARGMTVQAWATFAFREKLARDAHN